MTVRPKVRYVIPSYNQGAYLGEAVRSVLAQDYDHLELIVCDGASTDNSVEVLRSFPDPRLRWVSERDGGQTAAILKGLGLPGPTPGDYVYFNWLGSDDLLAGPTVVSALVRTLESGPADVAYGEGEYIDADGNPTGLYRLGPADPQSLRQFCTICQPSALIRKAAYDRAGGLDASLTSIMDYDLWLRLSDTGARFVRVPGVISRYRIHRDSKTASIRTVTFREIFTRFAERGERVGWETFADALRDCVWSPLTGRSGEPDRTPAGLAFKLLRRVIWWGCRSPAVQRRVPRLFRPPRHDPLTFTRSYAGGGPGGA